MSDTLASLESQRAQILRQIAELGDFRSGSRLKRSGMSWTVGGANAILALRCCRLNGQFEDYREGCSA